MIKKFGDMLRNMSKKWIGKGWKMNGVIAPFLLVLNMYWYLFLGILWGIYFILFIFGHLIFPKSNKKNIQQKNEFPKNNNTQIDQTIKPNKPAVTSVSVEAPSENNPKQKTHEVAGVNYRIDNFLKLAVKNDDYFLKKSELVELGLTETRIWEYDFYGSKVELVPEPDNPYDPNAIKVVIDSQHIGYIKQGSCAHIHKLLKNNRIQRIDCILGGGNYKYITEDINEDGEEIYTLEQEEHRYSAKIIITELPE